MPGMQAGMMPGMHTSVMPGMQAGIMPGMQAGIMPGMQTSIMPGTQTGIMPGMIPPGMQTGMGMMPMNYTVSGIQNPVESTPAVNPSIPLPAVDDQNHTVPPPAAAPQN